MFSFLSSIFWTAVFFGGYYKLYKSIKAENIDMDLSGDKVEKLTEQSPFFWGVTTSEHLNNKTTASQIGLYTFIIVFSLWVMENDLFLLAFLLPFFAFGVISCVHIFGVAVDAGRPRALGPDGKFNFALIPLCLSIFLFFASPTIFDYKSYDSVPSVPEINAGKVQKLKSVHKSLRKLYTPIYDLQETFDAEFSKNESEEFYNIQSELDAAKNEYFESLRGLTFTGKCFLKMASYTKSPNTLDEVFQDDSLSRKQYLEQYPEWLITCTERKNGSGSSYKFFLSEAWLTEKEIDLFGDIREGDSFNFTGTASDMWEDTKIFGMHTPYEYGLLIWFTNQVWIDGDNKETEKTIFFD